MKNVNPLVKIGEVIIMVSAIFWCCTIIGMIWGIPMFKGCSKRIKGTKEVTIGHLVIAFFFYWFIGALLATIGWALESKN